MGMREGLWVALLTGVLAMGGCGGGGAATPEPENTLQAQYKADLHEISAQAVDGVTMTTVSGGGGETLRITDLSEEFENLVVGQSVVLAPSESQGIPLGFAGVVHSRTASEVVLRDARVDEVFDKLSLDFDTARAGAFVGTVAPQGARLAIASASEYSGSIDSTGSGIDLTLQVNRPAGPSARLVGKIELKGLRLSSKIDFDILEYWRSFGFNLVRYEWTGRSVASLSLESIAEDGTEASVSWGDLFPKLAGGDYRWDQPMNKAIPGTKWLTGATRYFSLSGLDKSDRAGLVPLGGVVFAPAGVTTFVNQPSVLQQVPPMAFVLWLYIDANGEVKFVSENKLLEADSGVWRSGMRVERGSDNGLTSVQVKDYGSPTLASHVTGAVQASQNLGAAIGADLIVGGIRPASGKIELFGAEFKGKLESSRTAGIQWYPTLSMLLPKQQDFCASYAISTYSEASYRLGIKASSPIPGLADVSFAHKGSTDRKVWQETGDFFAQNCPLDHVLTVTKVEKAPPVTRTDCGTGDPDRRCDLYCEVDETLQIGQEIKGIQGTFTVNGLQRGGKGQFHFDSADSDTLMEGTFGQQWVDSKLMGKFAQTRLFDPINVSMPPILYSSQKALEFSSTINRTTADMTGTFTTSKTNGWSVDASKVQCQVQYGVKSSVAWIIKP